VLGHPCLHALLAEGLGLRLLSPADLRPRAGPRCSSKKPELVQRLGGKVPPASPLESRIATPSSLLLDLLSTQPAPTPASSPYAFRLREQKEDAATGLDTGCVYGGKLTAAVLPPLDELAASQHVRKRLDKGEPPSLKDLGAELVDAEKAYAASKDD
jgi:hypothetical protein